MQLQSTLSRLAAFALFLLSFSMLACAAPAPAAGLAVRDNSLVARADVTDQVYKEMTDLSGKTDDFVKELNACYAAGTSKCDVKPILVKIVAYIQAKVDLFVALKVKGTIKVNISVWVKLIVDIVVKLAVAVKPFVLLLGTDITIGLNLVLGALINIILELCVTVGLKLALSVALTVRVDLLLSVGLKLVLSILGLIKL